MKVAEIARDVLAPMVASGKATDEEIQLMQTKEYSKEHFHLNYPILLKINKGETRPIRYYLKPIIKIGETEYYLCSEWYEKPGTNNDRPYLLKWIADHQ